MTAKNCIKISLKIEIKERRKSSFSHLSKLMYLVILKAKAVYTLSGCQILLTISRVHCALSKNQEMKIFFGRKNFHIQDALVKRYALIRETKCEWIKQSWTHTCYFFSKIRQKSLFSRNHRLLFGICFSSIAFPISLLALMKVATKSPSWILSEHPLKKAGLTSDSTKYDLQNNRKCDLWKNKYVFKGECKILKIVYALAVVRGEDCAGLPETNRSKKNIKKFWGRIVLLT